MKTIASFLLSAVLTAAALAQRPNYAPATVVVYNETMPESKALAQFYAKARQIPEENLVGLNTSKDETITRLQFAGTIEAPLRQIFTMRKWWKMGATPQGEAATEASKRVIALMYGVPVRISEEPGAPGPVDPATGKPTPPAPAAAGQQNAASVDGELAMLGLPGRKDPSGINNPYFNKDEDFYKQPLPMMMLVGRIDGPSVKVCERMITDAVAVEKTGLWGRAYLDLARKGGAYDEGDAWILLAGKTLGTAGWCVTIDAHPQTLPTNYPMADAAVYLGWYVRSPDGPFLDPAFRFKRGAVACHIHSFSAMTLRSETAEWCGPLLSRGATAVLGNVWEPYLTLTTHLDVFTDRLMKGYTLAEAGWMATPALSWMNLVLGDPLYRPFANQDDTQPTGPDAEFKIYHATVSKLSSAEDKEPLMKALEQAAAARKSGFLWESLGLLAQTYFVDDMKRAAKYFETAAKTYAKPSDRIRCYLHVPDMQRRNNVMDGAVADLKRIITEYPKEPATEAARMWLNTLQPPPPPPPPAPPAGGKKGKK